MLPQLTLDGTAVDAAPQGPRAVAAPSETEVLEVPFQGFYGAKCVACPACGAPAGAHCRRPSGHAGRFAAYHAARRNLAARVRLLGLRCRRCGVDDGPGSYVSPASREPNFVAVGYAGEPLCRPCAVHLVPESTPTYD